MFIYEFMGGVAETFTHEGEINEDEQADYDPHVHRRVEKPTTYSETMIHMLKGSIGAGILAMPAAFERAGILFGLIGLFFIGAFATYCIQLLIAAQYELCKRAKVGYMTYPSSMYEALKNGPPPTRNFARLFSVFIDVVLVGWQLGLCCVYNVFVAENVKQVCDYYGGEFTIRVHICYLVIPLVVLNMVKNLKLLSPISCISNIFTLLGLILVFYYLLEDDLEIDFDNILIENFSDIAIFMGTTLFALEAVGVILALEYNMENPKRFVGWCGLFNIAMSIILSLYATIGAIGYLKYGENIKASITLNLPQEQKKAHAAKLILGLAIFLSFPLQNYVAYIVIFTHIKRRCSVLNKPLIAYSLRIVLVLIPVALAIAVPNLGPIISLIGACCLSLLAIIFPAITDVCLWYPGKYGFLKYKLLRDLFICLVGFLILITGVYTSVKELNG